MALTLIIGNKNYSSWSMRAGVLVAQAGIPCETVVVRFDSFEADSEFKRTISKLNPAGRVPVLVDGSLTVVDSADILAHLEDRFPRPALLPTSLELRAKARSWQRIADGVLDAIVHDISLWTWPTHHRKDAPPPGLLDAGHRDLEALLLRFRAGARPCAAFP